jgi:hypothetical protein
LASLLVVAITRAPAARANCDTPPDPITSTVSPGRTPRSPVIAFQAVTAAHGRHAACSSLSASGTATSASAGRTAYSRSIPSSEPPS